MSIEQIKTEIMCRYGLKATNGEAGDIKAFAEECPWASLTDIISDYYGC